MENNLTSWKDSKMAFDHYGNSWFGSFSAMSWWQLTDVGTLQEFNIFLLFLSMQVSYILSLALIGGLGGKKKKIRFYTLVC